MQSLPQGSTFRIISFGSNYEELKIGGNLAKIGSLVESLKFWKAKASTGEVDVYNESNKAKAIDAIGDFDSDLGSTNMAPPLQRAFDIKVGMNVEKRIFLLTDGYADSRPGVEQVVTTNIEKDSSTRLFTFGLSDSCDTDLVTKLAKDGRGTPQFIGDNEILMVKEVVLKTMTRAGVKSLENCTLNFNNNQNEGYDAQDNEYYMG